MRRPQAGSLLCVLVAAMTWFSAGLARAEPPAVKSRLSTATYDVADLVQSVPTWRQAALVAPDAGVEGADALVQVILRLINPESWRPGKDSSTLQVLNGTRLEVRTTLKQHADIKQLLEALRRLSDIAVVLHADLYEVDRAFYKKHVEPLFTSKGKKPFAVPVEDGMEARLLKQTRPLKESRVMIPSGKEGVFFSVRNGFTYLARARTPDRDEQAVTGTGFQGVTFRADVTVSADRRSLQLKMSQTATELREIVKKPVLDPDTKKKEQVESPRLANSSTTGEVEVEDGTALLLPVGYRSRIAKDNDRVWVLLLRPIIYIEEEEKAKANNRR